MRLLLPRSRARSSPTAGGRGGRQAARDRRRSRRADRVVDDDEHVRAFLADVLTALGHRVETLDGAEAALAALAEGAPDLVLIDFAMPGMNGAELAAGAARAPPGLPIVFVTGFAESDQLEGALGATSRC